MTPIDGAVLLLAALLHDSAMHMTPESFVALITTDGTEKALLGSDRETWSALWDRYITEVAHWTDSVWREVLGEEWAGEGPSMDLRNIDELREARGPIRLMVGEFIL